LGEKLRNSDKVDVAGFDKIAWSNFGQRIAGARDRRGATLPGWNLAGQWSKRAGAFAVCFDDGKI
jgi:hypothetical protein